MTVTIKADPTNLPAYTIATFVNRYQRAPNGWEMTVLAVIMHAACENYIDTADALAALRAARATVLDGLPFDIGPA